MHLLSNRGCAASRQGPGVDVAWGLPDRRRWAYPAYNSSIQPSSLLILSRRDSRSLHHDHRARNNFAIKGLAEAETGTESQAAASYIPLFLSNAALALYIAVFPKEAADSLFGAPHFGTAYPAGVIPLMRLVSAGFATASFTSLALKQALENRPINRGKFIRLNLGLSAFATLNILLLTTSLVTPEGSVDWPARPGFWAAAVVYACTLLVSWGKYGKDPGVSKTVKETVPKLKTLQRDVQDFVDQRSLDEYFPNSYTVITLSLAAWGLAQIFVPWEMLDLLLRNDGGDETQLMARLFSTSLITLLPTVSYSLKEVAKDLKIRQLPSKCLNYSLAATAVLNVAVLLPYFTHGQGGPLLGPYLLLWVATLTTSVNYGFLAKE